MTVIVTKDAINLREKLSELDKETGIKGEELMRADTSAEAREALQLDQQLFTDFESTGIDDNATSTAMTLDASGNAIVGGTSAQAGDAVTLMADGEVTAAGFYFSNNIGAAMNSEGIRRPTTGSIAFDTASTERMRILSTGSVLFGQSLNDRPAEFTQPTGASIAGATGFLHGQYQSSVSGLNMLLNRKGSDGSIIAFRKDGTDVGVIGTASTANFIITSKQAGHGGIEFGTNNIMPMIDGVLTSNATDLGSDNYQWKNAYLSGGIHLGGTTAANLLDDYEEGTWTAVYSPSVSSFGTITMTTYVGDAPSYVKIGRMVTVTAVMSTYDLTIGAASGDVRISGLPFTIDKSGAATISDTIGWAGQNPLSGSILGNNDITLQYRSLVDGDDTILNVTDLTTGSGMSNSNYLKFTLTYMTDA